MGFTGTDKEKTSFPFDLQLARGKIPDMRRVFIAGFSTLIQNTTRQVWNGTSVREFKPASVSTVSVLSDSPSDTFVFGIGAQLLFLEGIDENFKEISELAVLTGTQVILLTQKFIKINTGVVVQSGNLNTNSGTILIFADGNQSNLLSLILPGDGATKISSYLVPDGFTLFIQRVTSGTQKNTDADVQITIAFPNGSEFNFDISLYQNTVDLYAGYFQVNERQRFLMTASQQSASATTSILILAVLVKN